ncbi:hypothetical protein BKA65DRAFT_516323 [Rhexocercosporidium sp. MPI-PUGE-AT-0058]|nr:hypothetical protein BKA65DRAFT_516323 [Rhexocercosporidium sp. MPI-PUGE-AT-0058]
MAEIGLLASIIGIAGAGAKLSKGLWDVAKAFGSAGKDVKLVATEINTLCRVFTQLGNTLKGESAATQNAERLAGDVLDICADLIVESQELLDVLKPLAEMAENHFGKSLLRLQWLLKKSRFAAHKQSLGMLQGTLTLLFSGMTYAAAIETKESDVTRSLLRAELENSKENVQEHSRAYLGLARILRNGDLQVEILSEYTGLTIDAASRVWRSETGEMIEEQTAGDTPEKEEVSTMLDQESAHPQDMSDTAMAPGASSSIDQENSNSMALALRSRLTDAEEDELDNYEMQEDLQFKPSERVLDFYIKLDFIQRATVRFAEYALNPETERIWEAQATARAPAVDTFINPPSQNSTDDSSSSRSRRDHLQTPQPDGRSQRSSGNDFQVSSSAIHPREEEVLNFRDSRGWEFKFPFDECKTYQVSHFDYFPVRRWG